MNYILSRHAGAIELIKEAIGDCAVETSSHLDSMEKLNSGDCIYGNLPMHQIVALSARNIRYVHLSVTLPEHLRGRELTVDQLRQHGAVLNEYHVRSISDNCLEIGAIDPGKYLEAGDTER